MEGEGPRLTMFAYSFLFFFFFPQMTFKVNSGATSPLVFVASVWKGGIKLQTAAPVQVTVTSK